MAQQRHPPELCSKHHKPIFPSWQKKGRIYGCADCARERRVAIKGEPLQRHRAPLRVGAVVLQNEIIEVRSFARTPYTRYRVRHLPCGMEGKSFYSRQVLEGEAQNQRNIVAAPHFRRDLCPADSAYIDRSKGRTIEEQEKRREILRKSRIKQARRVKANRDAWAANHRERMSVTNHYRWIFKSNNRTYVGMSFYDEWNPKKGGSFDAGANWIIANLGRRPGENYQLHIIDRSVGFVPGNLEWQPRDKHRQAELINSLRLKLQQRDEFDEDGKDPEPIELDILIGAAS